MTRCERIYFFSIMQTFSICCMHARADLWIWIHAIRESWGLPWVHVHLLSFFHLWELESKVDCDCSGENQNAIICKQMNESPVNLLRMQGTNILTWLFEHEPFWNADYLEKAWQEEREHCIDEIFIFFFFFSMAICSCLRVL